MRRRILAILPVFLVALLVQAYAPVGSARAIAHAQHHAVAAPCPMHARQPAAPQPHAPGPPCDLCAFVFSGAAPLAFDAPQIEVRPVAPHRVDWVLPEERKFVGPRRVTAQARAPPSEG
ncbi:hypothetical protein M2323_004357 [Rhodoblastus acidophilus]|uniref:hypothetical protein n=1 Tax=Rhodoblastus acidophilus TaxID=1074 RepID=UPI0022250614|nr:hypothetical protein [Rhodoblastus acidophilus]MCW2286560.1 hypothetical protein [Rhodoblastus acidophilus]MCW2335409.1 hypothetical protein [Rhodoblastus acidophilus]